MVMNWARSTVNDHTVHNGISYITIQSLRGERDRRRPARWGLAPSSRPPADRIEVTISGRDRRRADPGMPRPMCP